MHNNKKCEKMTLTLLKCASCSRQKLPFLSTRGRRERKVERSPGNHWHFLLRWNFCLRILFSSLALSMFRSSKIGEWNKKFSLSLSCSSTPLPLALHTYNHLLSFRLVKCPCIYHLLSFFFSSFSQSLLLLFLFSLSFIAWRAVVDARCLVIWVEKWFSSPPYLINRCNINFAQCMHQQKLIWCLINWSLLFLHERHLQCAAARLNDHYRKEKERKSERRYHRQEREREREREIIMHKWILPSCVCPCECVR